MAFVKNHAVPPNLILKAFSVLARSVPIAQLYVHLEALFSHETCNMLNTAVLKLDNVVKLESLHEVSSRYFILFTSLKAKS